MSENKKTLAPQEIALRLTREWTAFCASVLLPRVARVVVKKLMRDGNYISFNSKEVSHKAVVRVLHQAHHCCGVKFKESHEHPGSYYPLGRHKQDDINSAIAFIEMHLNGKYDTPKRRRRKG